MKDAMTGREILWAALKYGGGILIAWIVFLIVFYSLAAHFRALPFFYVAFAGQTGWIVGERSWQTVDGGETWKKNNYGMDYWYQLTPRDAALYVSLSSEGALYDCFGRYRGSRVLWKRMFASDRRHGFLDPDPSLWRDFRPVRGAVSEKNCVSPFIKDSNFGFIVNREDSGEYRLYQLHAATGHLTRSDFSRRPMAVVFGPNGEVFALAGDAGLFASYDQGLSWSPLPELPTMIFGLAFQNGRLWIVGREGFCGFLELESGAVQILDAISAKAMENGRSRALIDIAFWGDQAVILGTSGFALIARLNSEGLPESIEKVPISRDHLYSLAISPTGTAYAVGGRSPNFLGWGGSADVFVSDDFRTWRRLSLQ